MAVGVDTVVGMVVLIVATTKHKCLPCPVEKVGRSRATDGDLRGRDMVCCAVLWCSRRMSGKPSPYLLTYTELSLRANLFFFFLSFFLSFFLAFLLFLSRWLSFFSWEFGILLTFLLASYIDRLLDQGN